MYHNTLNLQGQDLFSAHNAALKQDKSVLDFCKTLGVFSATKLWKKKNNITDSTTYAELKKIEPVTSIRRSLNTLENEGSIIRLQTKVKSDFNSKEFLYQCS